MEENMIGTKPKEIQIIEALLEDWFGRLEHLLKSPIEAFDGVRCISSTAPITFWQGRISSIRNLIADWKAMLPIVEDAMESQTAPHYLRDHAKQVLENLKLKP